MIFQVRFYQLLLFVFLFSLTAYSERYQNVALPNPEYRETAKIVYVDPEGDKFEGEITRGNIDYKLVNVYNLNTGRTNDFHKGIYISKTEGLVTTHSVIVDNENYACELPGIAQNSIAISNIVPAGYIIAPTGTSGGVGEHIHFHYGKYKYLHYDYSVDTNVGNSWNSIRGDNVNSTTANPLVFFSSNARPSYKYNIHFFTNAGLPSHPKPQPWAANVTNTIYRGTGRFLAMVQARTNCTNIDNPAHGIDDKADHGLDLNTVYYRLVRVTNTLTSNYLAAHYQATNTNQLLAIFTARGRGMEDVIPVGYDIRSAGLFNFSSKSLVPKDIYAVVHDAGKEITVVRDDKIYV